MNGLLHSESGIGRADRVVLQRQLRYEERHDAVAHDLVHGAVVSVDRLHHPFEHRIEDPPRVFRVAVREKFHRALQVGEENSDLLTFAFECALRSEDPVGEMPRSVGLGSTAGATELLSRPDWLSTARAYGVHAGAAVLAELGVVMVVSLAPRTLHPGASLRAGSRRTT